MRVNDFIDDPVRQCHGKRTYNTKADAKSAIKRIQTSSTAMTAGNKPYRCPHCTSWHIGHYRPPTSPEYTP